MKQQQRWLCLLGLWPPSRGSLESSGYSLSSQSIRWFSVAGSNFSRDLEVHILMTIFLICSLLHILALVFKTITLFLKMAEILAIWVRGTCVILRSTVTSTPSWHVLLLDCPVTTSLHSLRNWSRWLHTADQTILFAGKCPIVQFSNAWAPETFFYTNITSLKAKKWRDLSVIW